MTATQNPAQDVSDQSIAAAFCEYCHYFPCATITVKHWVQNRAKEIESARELQQARVVGGHCQNGRGDVCRASQRDGIVCPEDSCDIDDGTRKPDATPQSSAPVVGADRIMQAIARGWCSEENQHKEMDVTLAKAIHAEVMSALTGRG